MANDILWIEPEHKRRRKNSDCKISHVMTNKKKMLCVTFYNGSWSKVTHHDYVSVGVDITNGRLVFEDPYPNNLGYKLTKVSPTIRCVRINFTDDSLDGEYNLVPDDDRDFGWHTERA